MKTRSRIEFLKKFRLRNQHEMAEFSRWAAELYSISTSEPPLRGAIFTIEQLELHAKTLAATHTLGNKRGRDRLLKRLTDSECVIGRCHDLMSEAQMNGQRLSPAAEWLLDNHYLIEEQIFLTRKHFPRQYSRQLPHLAEGESKGLPRIYDLMLELISHMDGRVDGEALARYTTAYQSITHLTLGELWSVAIMLRLALIENLRRVAVSVSWQRAHRDFALIWAKRINDNRNRNENSLLVLADLVRENPRLSTAFIAQFTQALQGHGATTTFVMAWLEQRLAETGQTIEEVVRAESQSQAADQASMANSIASLRFINATEWHKFVEAHSITEEILHLDPAGIYPQMDFATRDEYRHVIENLAQQTHLKEEKVAEIAIALATTAHTARNGDVAAHVGYLLMDDGKPNFIRVLRGYHDTKQAAQHTLRGLRLLGYLGSILIFAVVGSTWLFLQSKEVAQITQLILILCAIIASSQCAIAVVNWLALLIRRPRAIPRMDFEHGIPDDCRTMVVIPTLLTSPERIAELVENLEIRFLANRDPNLWFALLTDFGDADQEHVAGDEALLALARKGIEDLIARHSNETQTRFFLFHRPRLFNPQEKCWMGHERKRGKLEDFNALLCGEDRERFSHIVGDASHLTTVRYVITLDTDTDLPWGSGWRLVGAAAHPLHHPVLTSDGKRLLRGYAILQPRVSISLDSALQSHYSRLMAGEVGIDPYTRVVSDLYQDIFSEASFIGKGIYEVNTLRLLLDRRFPDNTVLSHDLLESCYARTGQCSDVELLENAPARYLADVSRRHRWMRGDWQIAPWLGLRVSNAMGEQVRPWIAALGWWKIFDNLRRALVAPAFTVLLALGWLVLPATNLWTAAVLLLLFVPELLPGLAELAQRPSKLPLRLHATAVGRSTVRRLAKIALWLTFLPFEAKIAIDAAVRSLWRMRFSKKKLLEWQTAAAADSAETEGGEHILQRMWLSPAFALTIGVLLTKFGIGGAAAAASPILLLWFFAPFAAWWVSLPLQSRTPSLSAGDTRFLRKVARLTWRYFEVFAGAQENWLPPDNVQLAHGLRIAHRTSPTDMSLALLSNLSAHDLGYVSTGQLLERTIHALDSMEQMERYHGHFLNWYETNTRKALRPRYISTVDSGNLVGHARVLRSALLELATAPVLPSEARNGLLDTLQVLVETLTSTKDPLPSHDHVAMEAISKTLLANPEGLLATAGWLRDLAAKSAPLASSFDRHLYPELSWWANALDRQIKSFLEDLTHIAPWLDADTERFHTQAHSILAELDQASNLQELGRLSKRALESLLSAPATVRPNNLIEALMLSGERISLRTQQINLSAERCQALAEADFSFLYNDTRKLFSIGYWLDDRRLDNSYYDLLASEARLASFTTIAAGQIPFDHWFALGRRLTTASGKQVLLSWSGSMFEYLMPLLIMPAFDGTLLDETCRAAVARQIEYGRQRGVPWGISESCYSLTDTEGTYQYRAFGVPGLGLQRGLSDDVVVSPYATALALLIDPQRACKNLRRMAEETYIGQYGFFEAIDFTPVRMKQGERHNVIQTFMAHHHGMSLMALSQTVLGQQMQRRFLSNPDFRAAALLLQERIPKGNVLMHPYAREARVSRLVPGRLIEPTTRIFNNPNTPVPDVHLLSNGRYHVMVSASGSGYSRWNDLAITRWREDPTSESLGVFCFIGDQQTHRYWSNAFQPTLHAGRHYEAVFTPGRAEFRRHDDRVETHTEIAVSPEDDLEIRRIRLTNRSESARSLEVTSYVEVVLAPGITDELHRVFSNLFVHIEISPNHNALLITRRAHSAEETPPWMFCALHATVGEAGECSFATDRMHCIGRNHSLQRPHMMNHWGALPGIAETALDPCVALRRAVELPIDRSVQLDLIIGAAPTREAALALISKYQDHRMADRVFELASTHSRAVQNHLGVDEAESQQYEQLASAVIFPVSAYRAPNEILRRNRKGQAGLWRYAVSGDLPIVLLRVNSSNNLNLVRDVLQAHAYWRMRGLLSDLVIWNEDVSGYRRILYDQIQGIIAAGTEAQIQDKPGGIFVRHIDDFPEDDRVLMLAVARIVIRDIDGPLDQQLERWRRALQPTRPAMPLRTRFGSTPKLATRSPVQRELVFENGIGGFTPDGREYIVSLSKDHRTPAPWVNVIANERFGTVVSEGGVTGMVENEWVQVPSQPWKEGMSRQYDKGVRRNSSSI